MTKKAYRHSELSLDFGGLLPGITVLLKYSLSLNPDCKKFSPSCAQNSQYFTSLLGCECSTNLNPWLYQQYPAGQQSWAQYAGCWLWTLMPVGWRPFPTAWLYPFTKPYHDIFHPPHHFYSIFQYAYLIKYCITVWLSLPLLFKAAWRTKSGLDPSRNGNREGKASFRFGIRYTCHPSELQQPEAWIAKEVSQYFKMSINKYIHSV